MIGWRFVAIAMLVVSCGSSPSGGNPSGTGGTSSGGNGATGGSGASGAGGTGVGGNSPTGGTGGSATAPCTSLSISSDAQPLYTLGTGTAWYLAGSDSQGTLLAIDENRSVRVVSATPNGTAQVLLDETTYQKSWSFDPTDVLAIRRSDGVDVLVSDDSHVVLVRKQDSSVRVVELANTNESDLTAMALTNGSAGTLAVFQEGHDTYGTTQKVTAVDVDPLIAAAGTTPANISLAQQISSMSQASRSFTGPAGAAAVSTPSQVWLTIKRLNATTDCQDTGQTATCSGGNPAVPWLDCASHVDAFKLQKGADLQAAPIATVDGRAVTHQACSDATPVNANSVAYVAAVDPATAQLGIALSYQPTQTASGLQFALISPSGAKLIDGVNETQPSSGGQSSWTIVRSGHLFVCSTNGVSATCWVATPSSATSFPLQYEQIAIGAVQTPTSVGVVESLYNSDGSAWYQPLDCAP